MVTTIGREMNFMNVEGRQFVDSNILVYAYDAAAGARHEAARTLIETLWSTRRGCLSVQVFQEFYVIVTRKVAAPLSSAEAAAILEELSRWRIHAPAAGDVLEAIRWQERHQLSFWDAMIVYSANALGCTTLWTEDLNAGQQIEGTLIATPFAGTST